MHGARSFHSSQDECWPVRLANALMTAGPWWLWPTQWQASFETRQDKHLYWLNTVCLRQQSPQIPTKKTRTKIHPHLFLIFIHSFVHFIYLQLPIYPLLLFPRYWPFCLCTQTSHPGGAQSMIYCPHHHQAIVIFKCAVSTIHNPHWHSTVQWMFFKCPPLCIQFGCSPRCGIHSWRGPNELPHFGKHTFDEQTESVVGEGLSKCVFWRLISESAN